jgi:outer membrane protein
MSAPSLRSTPIGIAHAARTAVLVAGALSGLGSARAQSLLELYDAAHGFDATYLSARALAESVPYRIEQAEALLRPSASLGTSASRVELNPPIFQSYGSNTLALTLSGRQPLLNRANEATVRQAEKSLDVSLADLDSAEQELILRLSQAYFEVLGAQDTLATTRTNKAAISEQLASAKRNFEVGTATITDTREAQARFDLATAQEIAADNDLRTKRIALDQLVGRDGVVPKPLAAPVALPAVTPNNVEAWVSQTDTAPTVRRAQLGYDIAKLETEKARAGHLPTVGLTGSYGRGHTKITNPLDASGRVTSSDVALTMTVPLFAGFSIQNRVKETLQLEEQSRNLLDSARRGTAQATRQVFFGVQSGQAQVTALEAAESSSQLALEATQLGYKVGVRVNLDVLNAQTQLFTTRRDLAKARYDVLVNSLKLRQAAGQLKPDDLRALNALIAP